MEPWEEVGMSKEKYLRKEREWLDQSNLAVQRARKTLLTYLEDNLGFKPTQHQQRKWSWTHIYNLQDIEYTEKWLDLLKRLNPPLALASNHQEKAHLEHFINSIVLSMIYPGRTAGTEVPVQLRRYIKIEPNATKRTECKLAVYAELIQSLPKQSKGDKGLSFQEQVLSKLDQILKRIPKCTSKPKKVN